MKHAKYYEVRNLRSHLQNYHHRNIVSEFETHYLAERIRIPDMTLEMQLIGH